MTRSCWDQLFTGTWFALNRGLLRFLSVSRSDPTECRRPILATRTACTPLRRASPQWQVPRESKSSRRTLFGCSAISRTPVRSDGTDSASRRLPLRRRSRSRAGTKFFLVADPHHGDLDPVLKQIHQLYADYVQKNPFYEIEQPIRCELFDIELAKLISSQPA
jgi:hypothetical protein